jgi:hypothetical protein
MFCPFKGGKISKENKGFPLAFSICSVTFIFLGFGFWVLG